VLDPHTDRPDVELRALASRPAEPSGNFGLADFRSPALLIQRKALGSACRKTTNINLIPFPRGCGARVREVMMTYATLMVHLDHEHTNDARIEITAELAEKFDARVIGVTACDLTPSAYYAKGVQAAKLVEDARVSLRETMAGMERRFRETLHHRAREIDWRGGVESPTDFVARQARAADLVIVGCKRNGGVTNPLRQLDVDRLLMCAGRPVFVVPPEAQRLDVKSILIAWKDTPQARRAVADALPLLHKAKDVTVVEVLEGDEDRTAALNRINDVAGWLLQHGIDAETLVPKAKGDPAGQLERVASDVGARVVVAGAYGHTRLREWALGGVTRERVAHATCCSLLSH
jgi:nucleotide-binding universal stress UspA family protein